MAGVAVSSNYSTNPMDYLNGNSGIGSYTGAGNGGYGVSGSGGVNNNSSVGGLSEQQIMQFIEELLQLFQQALQNASGSGDSDGGGAPPVGGSGGGGGGMPSMGGTPAAGGAPAPGGVPATGSAPPASGAPAPGSTPTTTGTPTTTSPGSSSGAPPAGLSTSPQTTANTPQQSQQVAQQYVQNLMHDFNLTQPQAEGIVANLYHESGGMNSGINQGGAIGAPSGNNADDNANGYGIAQWGGTRKQGLEQYASSHGLDPSSQAANYGYLKQELSGPYSSAIDAVKGTSSAQDATSAFMNAFEKPSDPELSSRLADLALIQG